MFRSIIKTVEVKRRHEVTDRSPDYTPLWIIVTLAHGYSFENWLDWPQCEDNWPSVFDKVNLVVEGNYVFKLYFRDYSKKILNGFKVDDFLIKVDNLH